MSKINIYILKELFSVLIITVIALTGALFLDKLLYLTGIIVNKGVPVKTVGIMIVYIAPAFLALTIPMGVLIASVVTFSRLSADSEIIALKAGGVSFYQILAPVMILSILAYITSSLIMIYALPWGNQSFRELLFNILHSQARYEIKAKMFNNDFNDMVIYVNEKDASSSMMKGVFISEKAEDGKTRIINASEGYLFSDKKSLLTQLILKDGTIHRIGDDNKSYHTMQFDQYILEMNISEQEKIKSNLLRGNRELSIKKLKEKIAMKKKSGTSFNNELVELYKKFSLPFTCLILGFIGAPLGSKWSRSEKSGSFAISLVIIVFYYIMLLTGQSIGDSGKAPPFIAMWTPNFIIIAMALYLVYKTANELPYKAWQYIADKLAEAFHYLKSILLSDIKMRKGKF